MQELIRENEKLNNWIKSIKNSNLGIDASPQNMFSNLEENDETSKFINSANTSEAQINSDPAKKDL